MNNTLEWTLTKGHVWYVVHRQRHCLGVTGTSNLIDDINTFNGLCWYCKNPIPQHFINQVKLLNDR